METIDTALIYAAGKGTRMGALTQNRPKPLLELAGRPLIDYGYSMIKSAGINDIHVNAAYLAPQIVDHFEGEGISVHVEVDGPYETGGTLKSLAFDVPERILALNSDVLFFDENPVDALLKNDDRKYDAILVLVARENAVGNDGQGDFFFDDGIISRRGEAPLAPYVYTGLQIITPRRALAFQDRIFSTNLIWDQLIEEGKLGAYVYEGRWMDLGNADSLERARMEFGGLS